jgi:pilus assembly protein Flp/PilA
VITRLINRLLRNDDGPTAVEYAVLLALIVSVVVGSTELLGTTTKQVFQSAAKGLGQKTDGKQDGHGQW